jgi:hypothetical protein
MTDTVVDALRRALPALPEMMHLQLCLRVHDVAGFLHTLRPLLTDDQWAALVQDTSRAPLATPPSVTAFNAVWTRHLLCAAATSLHDVVTLKAYMESRRVLLLHIAMLDRRLHAAVYAACNDADVLMCPRHAAPAHVELVSELHAGNGAWTQQHAVQARRPCVRRLLLHARLKQLVPEWCAGCPCCMS